MPAKKRSSSNEEENVVGDATAASASAPSSDAAPQPDEFRTFLVALATDPARLGEYIKDPDDAMRKAGISDVDQVVLKAGQAWMIHTRLSPTSGFFPGLCARRQGWRPLTL
jgi:hypothetical protein